MEKIPSPLENYLGIEIVEKGQGRCKLSLAYKTEVTNFHKDFHGGAIAALCDAAAVQSLRALTPYHPYLTVNIDIRYKKPSRAAVLYAEGSASHVKGKLFRTAVSVVDSDGVLVAEAEVKSLLPRFQTGHPQKFGV
jgi:uncharacterized protein (TIGR00369 family)